MHDRPLRVLVAYGSHQAADVANTIAETLIDEGIDAELATTRDVRAIDAYDAVIVGGAIARNHWDRDARRFVRNHDAALRARHVWTFTAGAIRTHDAAALVDLVGAHDHVTLDGDATKARAWARETAHDLDLAPKKVVVAEPPPPRAQHLLAALCMFVGVTAIGGGAALVVRPDGSLLEASKSWLGHSPFHSFLVPGLLLLLVLGIGGVISAVLVWRDHAQAPIAAVLTGTALLIWIVTQMILMSSHSLLQLAYLAIAVVILLEARRAFAKRLADTWHALAH